MLIRGEQTVSAVERWSLAKVESKGFTKKSLGNNKKLFFEKLYWSNLIYLLSCWLIITLTLTPDVWTILEIKMNPQIWKHPNQPSQKQFINSTSSHPIRRLVTLCFCPIILKPEIPMENFEAETKSSKLISFHRNQLISETANKLRRKSSLISSFLIVFLRLTLLSSKKGIWCLTFFVEADNFFRDRRRRRVFRRAHREVRRTDPWSGKFRSGCQRPRSLRCLWNQQTYQLSNNRFWNILASKYPEQISLWPS